MGLKELYREEKEAAKRGSFAQQIEALNGIGDHFRYKVNDLQAAIEPYQKAAQLVEKNRRDFSFDCSFSERGLAEIYTELGNRRKALEHAEKYRNLSEISGKHSAIQLSFHVTAWILEKCHSHKQDLQDAIRWINKSLGYLEHHGKDIDRDRVSVRSGGDSEKRKAKLLRLYSQILLLLGDVKTAKQKWLAALNYARRQKDEELKHELYLTQMDFPGEDKVAVSFNLMKTASKREHGSSIMEYENQKILQNGITNCLRALTACYQEHGTTMKIHFPDDYEVLKKLYKFTEVKRMIRTSEASFRYYEVLGDMCLQYLETVDETQNKKVLLDCAVENYYLMFKSSNSKEEKIKSMSSLAITLLEDVKNPAEAHGYLVQVLRLQEEANFPENQLMDTRLSLFNAECQLMNKTDDELQEDFEFLQRRVTKSSHKIELYMLWSKYNVANPKGAEFRQLADDVNEEESQESDVKENEEDVVEGSEETILKRCLDLLKKANTEEVLMKKKNEKNEKGETRLHEEARNEGSPLLRTLLEYGYSLDERDNGGWTPLSEAVNHGCTENVRLLLQYGADPNIPSKEGWEGSEFGGKVTPLMEACENGYLEIAALLMHHNASCTYRNEGNQTALDFLKRYIDKLDESDAELKLAKDLEQKMRRVQEEAPMEPFTSSSRKRRDESNDSRSMRSELEEDTIVSRSLPKFQKRNPSPTFSRSSKSSGNSDKIHSRPASLPDVQLSPTFSRSSHSSRGSERKRKIEFPIVSSKRRIEIPEDDVDFDRPEIEVTYEHTPKASRVIRPPSPLTPPRVKLPVVVEDRRTPQSTNVAEELLLKIKFEKVNVASAHNRMLTMSRTATIADVISRLSADLGHKFGVKLCQDDFELHPNISVSSLQPNLSFDCRLEVTSAVTMYKAIAQEPLEEMIKRLKVYDAQGILDLEGICPEVVADVTNVVETSGKPGSSLVLSRNVLDVPTAKKWAPRIRDAQKLIANGVFCDQETLEAAFEGDNFSIEVLDVSCSITKTQEPIANVISKSANLKILNLGGLKTSMSTTRSPIVSSILQLSNLLELDLSYAPWISPSDWSDLLSSLESLTSLSMVSAQMPDVSFEVTWLPNLERLNVTNCSLDWTTFSEWLTVSDVIQVNASRTEISLDAVQMVVDAKQESSRRLKLILRFWQEPNKLQLQNATGHVQIVL